MKDRLWWGEGQVPARCDAFSPAALTSADYARFHFPAKLAGLKQWQFRPTNRVSYRYGNYGDILNLQSRDGTTRYDIEFVNRASTFSLSVCLSVCQSRTALFS